MPGQWRPSLRRRCPSDALSVLALLLRVSGIGIGICAASLILPSQSQVPRRDVPPPRRGGVVAVGVSSGRAIIIVIIIIVSSSSSTIHPLPRPTGSSSPSPR